MSKGNQLSIQKANSEAIVSMHVLALLHLVYRPCPTPVAGGIPSVQSISSPQPPTLGSPSLKTHILTRSHFISVVPTVHASLSSAAQLLVFPPEGVYVRGR